MWFAKRGDRTNHTCLEKCQLGTAQLDLKTRLAEGIDEQSGQSLACSVLNPASLYASIAHWCRVGLLWSKSRVRTPHDIKFLRCGTCSWVRQAWHSSPSQEARYCKITNASAWHPANWPWAPFSHKT